MTEFLKNDHSFYLLIENEVQKECYQFDFISIDNFRQEMNDFSEKVKSGQLARIYLSKGYVLTLYPKSNYLEIIPEFSKCPTERHRVYLALSPEKYALFLQQLNDFIRDL
jgi:hypothetical protein